MRDLNDRMAPDALAAALDAHCTALGACRRCLHDPGIVRPVLARARTPRVMLIGQAPGQTEAIDGRPFAGRAGRTLFRWLARAGIGEPEARARVYFAAVTRCYPGPSASGRGDRVPSPRERLLCSSWLDDELRLIQPALLILVGRLAIDRFLGPQPLAHLIGGVHEVRADVASAATLAIPLPHPSGASSWIHAPGHGALLGAALDRLGAELRRLGVVLPDERVEMSAGGQRLRSVA